MAALEKAFANVRADEARTAGDKKIHGRTLTSENGKWKCGNVGRGA